MEDNINDGSVAGPPPMKKFIGTKIIKAEKSRKPFSVKQLEAMKPGDDTPEMPMGYAVMYSDTNGVFGDDPYISWSPTDVFEAAYRQCDAMTFGLAIEAMKMRKKVKLPKWGDDVFISIQTPDENSKMTAPYFYVTSRFGRVPWIPTMIEMFSEEWQIIDQ